MPRYVDHYAMNFGELQSDLLRKLWINPQEDSNGWPAETSFLKYSTYRVNKKLNQSYSDLVISSKLLRGWFIIPLTATYTQYNVPAGVYDIETVYLFSSSASYKKLEVYEESQLEDLISPGWRSSSGIPEYAYIGDRAGMAIKLGVAPAASTSATAVTVNTGGSTVTRRFGETDRIDSHAGVDSSGTSFVDAHGANYSYVVAGMSILNITTNTLGSVSSIGTTNTANDTLVCSITWSPGDEMRIFAGEITSTISIGALDASYILNPTIGSMPTPGITMAANNLLVRGFTQPILLSSKYQYPELNPKFHSAISIGAASFLGKEEPVDTPEFKQALVYEQQFGMAIQELSSFAAEQYKLSGAAIISRRK